MDCDAKVYRAARLLLGLKQADAAAFADVDRNFVVRLETGIFKRTLNPEVVKLRRFYQKKGIEFLDKDAGTGPGILWETARIDPLVQRSHLRAGRALAGLKQTDLARKAEVSQSIISRFSSGETQTLPSQDFAKIEAALNSAGVVLKSYPDEGKAAVRLLALTDTTADA